MSEEFNFSHWKPFGKQYWWKRMSHVYLKKMAVC